MYNTVHQYDLSFVPPQRRPKTKPQLVITIDKKHLMELDWRLRRIMEHTEVEAYLGNDEPFHSVLPDLFGKTEFGFGKCGFLTTEGEEAHLRIELTPDVGRRALTLNLLAQALIVPFEGNTKLKNRVQQVDLETRCSPYGGAHGYEHATGGYVSESVREWLKKQAGQHTRSIHGHTPLPQPITKAMQQAWSAMASDRWEMWTKECGGFVAEDGRFSLVCFGNACDLAIYPDHETWSRGESVRFGCHNLDHAVQQLTLVSGLARLCQLAREDG